jgi:glycosyltransferase involved in cell wall biosynthesis
MKILLVNSTCKVGGVSTFMLTLRSALTAQGHSCDLFFFEHGTMEARLPAGCPVRFGSLADCLELVARERYDVVHANNVDWPTGISAVRRLGSRLVVTAHKARESAWTYGWTHRDCDAFCAVSQSLAKRLQPFIDLPVHAVQNGIDVSRFTRGDGQPPDLSASPIVAWIGRCGSPLKGFDRFAAVAPALHRAGMRLWVVDQHGIDTARQVYPEAAAALEAVVDWWGQVEAREMPGLYQQIAASGGCVLSTSVAEGLPLALLEAQASGCLAIASDVTGNDECVSPAHGGIRFPLDADPALVARLVVATLADRAQVRARQATTAEHVRRRFGVDRMAREYLDIYRGESPDLPLSPRARRQARRRVSPLTHWRGYVTQRLGVGYVQLAASRQLLAAGHSEAGSAAALAALTTSPTIFIKPARLVHLVRALRRDVVDHQHRLVVRRHDAAGVARVEDLH